MRAPSPPDPWSGARDTLFTLFGRARGRHVWVRLIDLDERDRLLAHLQTSPRRLRVRASLVGPTGEVSQVRSARGRRTTILIDHYRPDGVAVAIRSHSVRSLARCLLELDLGIADVAASPQGH